MPHRRGFFQTLSALPFLADFTGKRALAAAPARDYLKELGVAPVINGMGAYTMITGSLMWPESVAAIQALSKTFVRIVELHDAVGKRIAQLLECEAAMVPSGAAAGLTLATAACITGTDEALIRRIPDTTGMKNEVLVQKTHRFPYDHMVRNCGVKLIEVETREELEQAIGERTALLLFLNKSEHLGRIGSEEFIAIGKRRGVPTLNDAAADVPPVENLKKYTRMGFDLVVFSGGKGIRGPQSAGLLLGRADLIRAARLNTVPYSDTMGRSCKVNKEELVAMQVAVEMYLKHDHAADWKEWERRVTMLAKPLSGVPGVKTERFVPQIANQLPHLRITMEPGASMNREKLVQALREGSPQIETVPEPYTKGAVEICPWTLQAGETEIVARRLAEIFRARG